MRTHRLLLSAGLVVALLFSVVESADAVPSQYFWRWSDESRAPVRTFSEGAYRESGRLPRLLVTAVPALPRREVRLLVLRKGYWRTEDQARTDSRGQAALALNPYCRDGDWCDDRQEYRLLVDGQSVRIRITYRSMR